MTPQAASSLALTIGTVIGIVGATVFYHAWKAGPPAFRAAVLSFVLPGGGHRTGVVGVLFFVGAVVVYGLLQSLGVVVALCAARHAATIAGSTSTPAPSVSRALVVFAGVLLALLLAVWLAQSMGRCGWRSPWGCPCRATGSASILEMAWGGWWGAALVPAWARRSAASSPAVARWLGRRAAGSVSPY